MSNWEKKTLRFKPNHSWKAKPGYNIFLADRGAVRFHVPPDWHLEPNKNSTRFFDHAPPKDNCRLECSYLRIPEIDWSGLPLSELFAVAFKDDKRQLTMNGAIVQPTREDLELAWAEYTFDDPHEQRPAFTRVCIARGSGIQTLITLDFWPEDADRLAPIWDEVMRTVELGKYVADPTKGDVIH